MYLSDITFRRAGDGSGDLIGYVSVTVDHSRHLSALEIRRAPDGTPCLGSTAGDQAKLLRAVRARERRLFQLQLFGELAKRGVRLVASGDATDRSGDKSDAPQSDSPRAEGGRQ